LLNEARGSLGRAPPSLVWLRELGVQPEEKVAWKARRVAAHLLVETPRAHGADLMVQSVATNEPPAPMIGGRTKPCVNCKDVADCHQNERLSAKPSRLRKDPVALRVGAFLLLPPLTVRRGRMYKPRARLPAPASS
jgi:hypothetical protein